MTKAQPSSAWRFALLPALAMSVGWGLRGFIGGGPVGAMIPGALVAMALSMAMPATRNRWGLVAAAGAVGIGFGGQMTYGQTVGFSLAKDTLWWGLAGLSLKGAVWGLLGGAVLGAAFVVTRRGRRAFLVALLLMVAGALAGWKLFNEPKLIYFSNPADKPRPEIWAGLLLGAVLFLAWLARAGFARIPARFALAGAVGGGLGFGLGGALQALGRSLPVDHEWFAWWKLMEFTFGFCFGLAVALCAHRNRAAIESAGKEPVAHGPSCEPWFVLLATATLAAGILVLEPALPLRFGYSIVGAFLIGIALYADDLAWQIAITLTFAGFATDLAEYLSVNHRISGTTVPLLLVATSLAVSVLVLRRYLRARPLLPWAFFLLLGAALSDSLIKAYFHPRPWRGVLVEQLAFLIGAAAIAAVAHGNRDSYLPPAS